MLETMKAIRIRCDTPGCNANHLYPGETVVARDYAHAVMRTMGWAITAENDEFTHLCPRHAPRRRSRLALRESED